MRTTSRRHAAVAACLVVAIGLTACGDDTGSEEGTASVRIFTGTGSAFAPVYVAQSEGYFDDHGVEVNLQEFPSGSEAIESLRAAGGGIFASGGLPAMGAWAVGDTVGIVPLSWDTSSLNIVATGGIDSPSDLAGGKMGTLTGTEGEAFVANYLEQHDLTGEVEVVNLSPSDMPAALARGDVRAVAFARQFTADAAAATPGSSLLQPDSEGYIVNHMIMSASTSTIEERPEVVEGVVAAIVDALELMRSDPERTNEIVAEHLDIDPGLVAEELDGTHWDPAFDERFVRDTTAVAETATELGILEAPWAPEHFDTSFLEQVDAALVSAAPAS